MRYITLSVKGLRTKLSGPGDLAWRAEAISAFDGVHAKTSTLRQMQDDLKVEA